MRSTVKKLFGGIMAFVMILSVTASPIYDMFDCLGINNCFVAGAEEISQNSEAAFGVKGFPVGEDYFSRKSYLIKFTDANSEPICGVKLVWTDVYFNGYYDRTETLEALSNKWGVSAVMTHSRPAKVSVYFGDEYIMEISTADLSEEGMNKIKLFDGITDIRYSSDEKVWDNGKNGGIDVMDSAHIINCVDTVFGGEKTFYDFYLYVKMEGSPAKNYEVYCDDKLVATSEKNIIKLNTKDVAMGGTLSLKVIFPGGESATKPIRLKVNDNRKMNVEVKLDIGSLNLNLPDSLSWIGSPSLSIPKFPIVASYTGDEIRLGVCTEKDILNDDSKWTSFKGSIDNYVKDMKNGISGLKALGNKEKLKQFLSNSANGGDMPGVGKIDFTICGYGSAKLDPNGDTPKSISFNLVISADAYAAYTFQTVVWVIPVLIDMSGGVELGAEFNAEFINPFKDNSSFSGNVMIEVKPHISAFAGIGLKKVASLGIYGGANLPIKICVINSDKSKRGFNTVDVSGEFGVKASFLFFSYKKELISGTYNIYTRPNYIAQTMSVRDEVMSVESYPAESSIMEGVLNADNYSAEQTGKAELSLTDSEQGIIAENASPFSDADILTDGDTIILAAVNTDTSRGVNNQTYIVTSVYSDGKWSEAVEVNGTGYAEFSPRLFKKGEDIFLIYQQATEIFDDDADMDRVTSAVGIALSRLDKATMTFGETKVIYDVDGYNFALASDTGYSVWYHNIDGNPFGNTHNNNLVLFDGDECRIIKEELPHIMSLAVGNISGKTYIAYTLEGDGNYDTNGDTKLYICDTNNTQSVLVAEGNIETVQFTDYNRGMLIWQEDTKLYCIGAAEETPSVFSEAKLTNTFCVLDDGSICYIDKLDPEGDSILYAMARNDGQLTAPFEYDVLGKNVGRMVVRDNTILCNLSDEDDSFGICDLYLKTIKEKTDIRIDYVDVDPYDLIEDTDVHVDVYLTNNGSNEVNEVLLSFTDKEGNGVGSYLLTNADLESGESAKFSVPVSDDADVIGEKFYVTAEEMTVTNAFAASEATPDNNTHLVDFTATAICVHMDDYISSKENQLYVKVENENHVPANGTIKAMDGEGNVIYTEDFEDFTAGELIHFCLDEEDVIGDGDLSEMVTVTVETTDGNDVHKYNNTQTHYIGTECPVQLYCTESDKDSATLTWDEVSGDYGVEIEQLIDNCWQDAALITDASVGSYTVTGLNESSEYLFRMRLCKVKDEYIQYSGCSDVVDVTTSSDEDDSDTDNSSPETDEPEADDSSKPAPDTGAEGMAIATGIAFALTGIAILSKKRR